MVTLKTKTILVMAAVSLFTSKGIAILQFFREADEMIKASRLLAAHTQFSDLTAKIHVSEKTALFRKWVKEDIFSDPTSMPSHVKVSHLISGNAGTSNQILIWIRASNQYFIHSANGLISRKTVAVTVGKLLKKEDSRDTVMNRLMEIVRESAKEAGPEVSQFLENEIQKQIKAGKPFFRFFEMVETIDGHVLSLEVPISLDLIDQNGLRMFLGALSNKGVTKASDVFLE